MSDRKKIVIGIAIAIILPVLLGLTIMGFIKSVKRIWYETEVKSLNTLPVNENKKFEAVVTGFNTVLEQTDGNPCMAKSGFVFRYINRIPDNI
jgi:hypothetical protein